MKKDSEWYFLKEVFVDSIMFPIFTTLFRFLIYHFIFFVDVYDKGVVGTENIWAKICFACFCLFALIDIGEVCWRIYGRNELENGSPLKNPSFSCFERHLFYDLPKYLINRRKEKEDEENKQRY